MTIQAFDQKTAIESLRRGEMVDPEQVFFNDEKVEALDAILLRRNGVSVPEGLVYYDDNAIDFSDDPELTDAELSQMRRVSDFLRPSIRIDDDIADWAARHTTSTSTA